MSIITVAGTIQESESTQIDMLKAAFGVTKNDAVRGLIRYALANPVELEEWMTNNQLVWRKYHDESTDRPGH